VSAAATDEEEEDDKADVSNMWTAVNSLNTNVTANNESSTSFQ
jgi:hypothetical protein